MTDNFTEYHSLGLSSSFRNWNVLVYALLGFKYSIEKSVLILVDVPLYMTGAFFPLPFSTHFFLLYVYYFNYDMFGFFSFLVLSMFYISVYSCVYLAWQIFHL